MKVEDMRILGENAKKAARVMALASTEDKNNMLVGIARALRANTARIIEANAIDMENGKTNGLSAGLLDRLMLNEKRINDIADSIADIISFSDPVGRELSRTKNKNGMEIVKVSTPIGVLGVIYEARPNVTVDSAVLALKSGNAIILRGGKEAINSNSILTEIMREAIEAAGYCRDAIQLVTDTDRSSATQMMQMKGYIDVLIPRGGKGLINSVVQNSKVPVIETGAGVCHIYVDDEADTDMAASVIFNAKVSRPSVCNSCECILVHQDIAEEALPKIKKLLDERNVELRGDARTCNILPGIRTATQEDWGTEYNDYILAVKVVDNMQEALDHIYTYSTGHSESIITENVQKAELFLNSIDSAAVYVNASTRFTDGGVFGLGAEIGISTQKLHARGPLGLNELTSMKYKIYGNGQVR